MSSTGTAFSYVRFSKKKQAKGDSLRRQTEAAAAWAERNGVTLDASLELHDKGVSAFVGKNQENPDIHALAKFLEAVEDGRVPAGSYLVVESLDRITREKITKALRLLLSLTEAGIKVVQLQPVEVIYTEDVEPAQLMLAIVELSRGNSESQMKSERCGAAWERKRQAARDTKKIASPILPAWVQRRGDKLVAIPERAAIVKRIYRMAADGQGVRAIVGRLSTENVPAWGSSQVWGSAYVGKILRSRSTLGEFQPLQGGKPAGPPIEGYFPRIIDEPVWHAVRAGCSHRRQCAGRRSKQVNLFKGLVGNPLGPKGDTFIVGERHKGYRVMLGRAAGEGRAGAGEGRGTAVTFPAVAFEEAVLSRLHEIDPRDVLGDDEGRNDLANVEAELSKLDTRIDKLKLALVEGNLDAAVDALRQLAPRRAELAARVEIERRKAATPAAAAWAQLEGYWARMFKRGGDPIIGTKDADARLRLGATLRRIVGQIQLVVAKGAGHDRLAGVQINFVGGQRRSFIVRHRLAWSNGKTDHPSALQTFNVPAAASKLDLNVPADARRLQAMLPELVKALTQPGTSTIEKAVARARK